MAINRIEFGGQVLPCYIERYPAIKKAARKFRQYSIPGRNGDIFFQDDAYENVIQPYQVYCGDDHYGAQMDWGELAKYLYLDGYQKLQDTYDPEHFRKAVFNGPLDVENSWNTHGRATLEFNCRPERYRIDGTTAISYEHQVSSVDWLEFDDLSTFLKSSSALGIVDTPGVYVVSLPAGSPGRKLTANWRNDGTMKYFETINVGTATTASTGSRTGTKNTTFTITGLASDFVFPDVYFDGEPEFAVDGEVIGVAGVIKNLYMPSHPDIVLHNVAASVGYVEALTINDKTIRIAYDADMPYYFIDTENYVFTCAETLDGERVPAGNVQADAGIQLNKGDNNIYTYPFYDVTITPNWWEL